VQFNQQTICFHPLTSCEDLSHEHFGNLPRPHPRSLYGFPNHQAAQLVRWEGGQATVQRSDGSPHCTDDVHFILRSSHPCFYRLSAWEPVQNGSTCGLYGGARLRTPIPRSVRERDTTSSLTNKKGKKKATCRPLEKGLKK